MPSLNVPVAVNWSVVPFATELLTAVMLIDCSVIPAVAALKFTDVFEDPLIVTVCAKGLKLRPLLLGVTV